MHNETASSDIHLHEFTWQFYRSENKCVIAHATLIISITWKISFTRTAIIIKIICRCLSDIVLVQYNWHKITVNIRIHRPIFSNWLFMFRNPGNHVSANQMSSKRLDDKETKAADWLKRSMTVVRHYGGNCRFIA